MVTPAPPAAPLPIVLLGASGFVGSALLRQMHDSTILPHLLVHRTPPASLPTQARCYPGSLTDLPADLLPDAPHVVIHCASQQTNAHGHGYGLNLQGIEALCQHIAAQPHPTRTRALLFLSSCSVYGQGPLHTVAESSPLRPATALARSRAACEQRLAHWAAQGLCRIETLRPRFVLGLGDRHVLPGLARLTARGLTLGSGAQHLSVIDVDDLARIVLARAQAALQETASPENASPSFTAYNVACERSISLHDVQALLCEQLALPTPRHHIPAPAWLLRTLAPVPWPALQQQVQRLSLLGQNQTLAVGRLAEQLPAAWLERDPSAVVRRATRWLSPQPSATYRWTH